MNKCKDCKWWYKDYTPNYGTCMSFTAFEDNPENNKHPAYISVWASYANDCGADLITREDFGCVLWEAKNNQGELDKMHSN